MAKKQGVTYAQAGVDINAGNMAVELIKEAVHTTYRPGVLSSLGGFGGLFALDNTKYKEPVLVSGTDGVGTKLRIAIGMDRHDTIGIDLVAMCVNDVLVQGAEPLFFLDYLAIGKLLPEKVAAIVGGIAKGCRQAGCALIGGETAEMPGFYAPDDYDLAGFAVGVVEKKKIIDGSRIQEGDLVLGLASSGLHSYGFSLARHVLLEMAGLSLASVPPGFSTSLGEAMLTPTRIYAASLLPLFDKYDISGLAHITGGGLIENIPRILPSGLAVRIDLASWQKPAIFQLIQELGQIDDQEMYRTFNMGTGMVLIVPPKQAARVFQDLDGAGEVIYQLGTVIQGDGGVLLRT